MKYHGIHKGDLCTKAIRGSKKKSKRQRWEPSRWPSRKCKPYLRPGRHSFLSLAKHKNTYCIIETAKLDLPYLSQFLTD